MAGKDVGKMIVQYMDLIQNTTNKVGFYLAADLPYNR